MTEDVYVVSIEGEPPRVFRVEASALAFLSKGGFRLDLLLPEGHNGERFFVDAPPSCHHWTPGDAVTEAILTKVTVR